MPSRIARPIRAAILALLPILAGGVFATGPAAAAPVAREVDDSVPAPSPREALRAQIHGRWAEEGRTKARLAERLSQRQRIQTANEDLYNVKWYDLNLTLNPTTHILSGTVTTLAQVVTGPLSALDLDLWSGMAVSAVTSGGFAATFTRAADVLTINLDRTYATGEMVTVSVTYSGNPSGDSFAWDTHSGQTMIWTLSEPFGAHVWWPCKDDNSDKADSVDMRATVPSNLIVASNGTLISNVDNGGTHTFHWHEGLPISTYLVSLAINPYTVFTDSYTPLAGGNPMELRYYVFSDHFSLVQPTYALVPSMLHAFALGWGEYPFVTEKFGHAEFTWPGGMEHQTISSLGGYGEDLISHELAHEWWGDMITCHDFHHVWLNEGFAAWAEAYWHEASDGIQAYHDYMDAAAYYGPGTVYVEDLSNFNAIFDSNLSYAKASWVLHMLRHVVGDTNFFAGLAHYRALYQYGNATTEQFRDAMEDVSGMDLHPFFQQWIYGEYFPVYAYSWQPSGGGVDVTINQVQTNTGLFTLPITLRAQTSNGPQDFVVQNAAATEQYTLATTGTVTDVTLDPDSWILRQVQSTVSNPTFNHGILVVNGVDWATYGTEITTAYADSIYWGANPISFWDTFPAPAGGYPANLPAPLGHGPVPAGTLGQYSTVIWVGNNFNGDLADWANTPIDSYLSVGGNLLLITRMGSSFLDATLQSYLGISWTQTGITLSNCTAQVAGLVNMGFSGTQSLNDVFSPTVGPNSTLLFRDTAQTNRGTGVIVQPPGGGSVRHDGGKFIFLAGRPYRFNHNPCRSNCVYLLSHYFGEPYTSPSSVPVPVRSFDLALSANRPNPFSGETRIPFTLPRQGAVELAVYDVGGRLVRELLRETRPAGEGTVVWNARDTRGARVAPGVYYVRMKAAGKAVSRPIVLMR